MASRLRITSSENCAVMFVDMVSSTKTSFRIANSEKLRLFYETFINTISEIATNHGARVVKNGGDSITCCFPRTTNLAENSPFRDVLRCGLEIINVRGDLNSKLESAGLPAVSYRISADYGKHEVVRDSNSDMIDLFGPTISICAKINAMPPPNNLLIGGDLYELVKSFSDFRIRAFGGYKIDETRAYPLFIVSRNNDRSAWPKQLVGIGVLRRRGDLSI